MKNHNNRKNPPSYLLPQSEIKFQNFGNDFKNFEELKTAHQEIQKQKGTGLQKKATLLTEGVLAFSQKQIEEIGDPKQLNDAIKNYMEDIKKVYGLEPIGFDFHADEGYKGETDKTKINYHAHLQFYNFDFEKEKAVMRNLKQKDFSHFQDIAEKHFKAFGFRRGEHKAVKRKHLDAPEFKELQDELTATKKENQELLEQNKALEAEITEYQEFRDIDLKESKIEELELQKQNTENKLVKRLITYAIRALKQIDEQKKLTIKNLTNIDRTLKKFNKGEPLDYVEDYEKITKVLKSLQPFIGDAYEKLNEEAFNRSNKRMSSEKERDAFDKFKKGKPF